ncbi:hypothetical protein ACROYT_G021915 [Oculina patagonica]
MAGLTCEKYPGIIKMWDIKFPKKNADVCGNFNPMYKKNLCLASESDEQKLKFELGKYCDDKRICNIHLAHGLYGGIHLPCRDLNINIRIEIFYDCIYSPVIPTSTYSSTEPSTTTESSSVSLPALPSFRSTNIMIETSIPVSKTTISSEATVAPSVSPTTTENNGQRWSRRRPKTCNSSFALSRDPVESNGSDFLSSVTLTIFSFSWIVVLVKH